MQENSGYRRGITDQQMIVSPVPGRLAGYFGGCVNNPGYLVGIKP